MLNFLNQKTPPQHLPKLNIHEYFKGDLEGYGIIQSRGGKALKTFTIKMHGSWKGNEGKLEEHFTFSDATIDHRIWDLRMIDEKYFIAKTPDVVGVANGWQKNNMLAMNYFLNIPFKNKKYKIRVKSLIYAVDHESLVGILTFKKFGFRLGNAVIGFKKIGI